AYPHSWLFFVPFIIVTSFAVLNLFIGIIVDAMQSVHEEDGVSASADSSKAEEDTPAKDPDLAAELAAIRSELVALRSSLQGSDKA
ncbi:MAG: ion transporter, partial [Rhodospirillaceae bacterium]